MKVPKLIPLLLLVTASALGQTTPVSPTEGIRTKIPERTALINATIHISPEQTIDTGLLLVNDGYIAYAGKVKKIPDGYRTIDLSGYTIYPGFIEPYSDYGVESPKRHPSNDAALKFDGDRRGGDAWNDAVHAEAEWVNDFAPDDKASMELIKSGFTTVQSCKLDGIFRGSGFVTHLGSGLPNDLILNSKTYPFASFNKGSSAQEYPGSLMGSIALIRQTFLDVDWYNKAHEAYRLNPMQPMPEFNAAIEALAAQAGSPIVFESEDELSLLRAERIAREFGKHFIHVGSGYEYSTLDAVKSMKSQLILPIAFPDPPEIESEGDELDISLAVLRHWETAPYNPARLMQNGIPFALTTFKLDNKSEFLANLRKAIRYGLEKTSALASITTIPAEMIGIGDLVGDLTAGKLADFIVTNGDIFEKSTKIYSVWIGGKKNELKKRPEENFAGDYLLSFLDGEYVIKLRGSADSLSGSILFGDEKLKLKKVSSILGRLSFNVDFDSLGPTGIVRFSGRKVDDELSGYGIDSYGLNFHWTSLTYSAPTDSSGSDSTEFVDETAEENEEKDSEDPPAEPIAKLTYPNMAFGTASLPSPQTVLVKHATIWTSEAEGILEDCDMLVEDGKISRIGAGLTVPPGAAEIDATGKHVTAGVIDPHSHIAISGGVNECTEGITAEVRIGDVVNPEHITIYRQLAGGTTTSLLLHGSCNAIGGQAQVIKLRWGSDSEGLKFEGTPRMIKFALGENVKRSGWGDRFRTRYPATRMGVESLIEDEFQTAVEYESDWDRYNSLSSGNQRKTIPPRRDLELDAARDIVNFDLRIVCHSYVQSEILALMRLAEEYDFHVQNFTHILEGYKVAPEMAAHGATASAFSDWWAYKFEVYDAIPYNVALMREKGVISSINSDDGDLGSRLNREAAKSLKYGNVPPEEAIKFCTINSAIQLGIDKRVGSLKEGKDADFVIWNGNPLSVYTKAEQTWIDGAKYFDLNDDQQRRHDNRTEKAALIQRILKLDSKTKTKGRSGGWKRGYKVSAQDYHCEDCYDYWEKLNNEN